MVTVCGNQTTGQTVPIFHPGRTDWNCEAAGLVVKAGDVVTISIQAKAD